jgi:enoyl-CoA hydratase/carnithine racemase
MQTYFPQVEADALSRFRWHFIRCEEQGDTLFVTLNNAERRNALNPVLLNELAYALAYAAHTPSLRFVRLRAVGEVFCAGADLRAFMGGVEHASTVPSAQQPIVIDELLSAFDKPLIAEVTGDVLAGGMLLITGATFVVAPRVVRFSLPEVHRGLFPFQVMKALSAFMPPRVVLGWCLLGETYTAEKLHEYKLVTHLVESRDAVASQVETLIAQLRLGAPLAFQKGLYAYHRLSSLSHAELNALLLELAQTQDAREGIVAFKEKRQPIWQGK